MSWYIEAKGHKLTLAEGVKARYNLTNHKLHLMRKVGNLWDIVGLEGIMISLCTFFYKHYDSSIVRAFSEFRLNMFARSACANGLTRQVPVRLLISHILPVIGWPLGSEHGRQYLTLKASPMGRVGKSVHVVTTLVHVCVRVSAHKVVRDKVGSSFDSHWAKFGDIVMYRCMRVASHALGNSRIAWSWAQGVIVRPKSVPHIS